VFSDAGDRIFTAGLDNNIRCFDLRKNETEYLINAHADTVTGLALSADGAYLLSNSMDMTLRVYDVRFFIEIYTNINIDPMSAAETDR
jgi:Prp8 binding protein